MNVRDLARPAYKPPTLVGGQVRRLEPCTTSVHCNGAARKPIIVVRNDRKRSGVQIMVNGQWRAEEQPLTVAELLRKLSLDPRRCAVELNKRIVPRGHHDRTTLADKDRLEIVTLVGGG